MANELKATIINMKSLNQNINDPVVVGAGDANGRTLRIIFTQEAAAQMTENTKVYLSWHHQEKDIKGYNIFTKIEDEEDEDFPPTWEIHYPKSMLYEGNVLACIQLVDEISISTSTNFTIHVLIDPNNGSNFTITDDFSEFQKAVINMSVLSDQMRQQMQNQKIEFEDMQLEFMDVRNVSQEAADVSAEAKSIAENALGISQSALDTIVDFTDIAKEARDTSTVLQEDVQNLREKFDQVQPIIESTADIAISAREIAQATKELVLHGVACGVTEYELNEAIENFRTEVTQQNSQIINQINNDQTEKLIQLKEEILEDQNDKIDQLREEIRASTEIIMF